MLTLYVVERVDVFLDSFYGLRAAKWRLNAHEFFLERGEEACGHSVVPTVCLSAYAGYGLGVL